MISAKQWLLRACNIDKEIQSKREQIEMWRSLATSTTRPLGGEPGGGGSGDNRIERYCIKIADAERELQTALGALVDTKREISSLIAKVPDRTQRVLLEQKYVLGKSWEETAEFLHYCTQYIKQEIHAKALKVVDILLKDHTK